MSNEKQSMHEIRMDSNAERERHARMGSVPFAGYVRPAPTQAEARDATRLNAARALPDEQFADNPEVQRLRAVLDTKVALIEKRLKVRDWLTGQTSRLEVAIADAQSAVPQAILEDALGQDEAFTKTRETLAELEFAKSVRAYADAAHQTVAPSNPAAQHALYDARDTAKAALNECLFNLKLSYVDAQAKAMPVPEIGGV